METDFWKDHSILVTGGGGFLGSYVIDELKRRGVTDDRIFAPRSKTHDLRKRAACEEAVAGKSLVIHLAGNVGGIGYNRDHTAEMYYDNLIMGTELMDAAYKAGVSKFFTLGTICSYPKEPAIPFNEDSLWDGLPESITGPYGLVKKMLMVQGQVYRQQYDFNAIFLLPTNLYGPRDTSSHVIPMLLKKFCDASAAHLPAVDVWGTGKATRDFLYVEDAARAIVDSCEHYNEPNPVNIGSGKETSIKELVELIAELTGFYGEIVWDPTKPEGQPRRVLDITRAQNAFDFKPSVELREGLKKTIEWYRESTKAQP